MPPVCLSLGLHSILLACSGQRASRPYACLPAAGCPNTNEGCLQMRRRQPVAPCVSEGSPGVAVGGLVGVHRLPEANRVHGRHRITTNKGPALEPTAGRCPALPPSSSMSMSTGTCKATHDDDQAGAHQVAGPRRHEAGKRPGSWTTPTCDFVCACREGFHHIISDFQGYCCCGELVLCCTRRTPALVLSCPCVAEAWPHPQ